MAFLLGLFAMPFGESFGRISFACIGEICYNGTWMDECGLCSTSCFWWQNPLCPPLQLLDGGVYLWVCFLVF
jgi:hypothetical protein